jgi:alkylation response protein AidB-like acyl-CoA dehydrogenase
MAGGATFGRGLEALIRLIGSGGWAQDRLALDTLGQLLAEAHSLSLLDLRMTLRQLSGADPGPESSVRKLLAMEHFQRVEETGMTLLGPEGATMEGEAFPWGFAFLANRSLTIAGGTTEVQRNVIAERLLGLPRDP